MSPFYGILPKIRHNTDVFACVIVTVGENQQHIIRREITHGFPCHSIQPQELVGIVKKKALLFGTVVCIDGAGACYADKCKLGTAVGMVSPHFRSRGVKIVKDTSDLEGQRLPALQYAHTAPCVAEVPELHQAETLTHTRSPPG